jgi:hypothetical protein
MHYLNDILWMKALQENNQLHCSDDCELMLPAWPGYETRPGEKEALISESYSRLQEFSKNYREDKQDSCGLSPKPQQWFEAHHDIPDAGDSLGLRKCYAMGDPPGTEFSLMRLSPKPQQWFEAHHDIPDAGGPRLCKCYAMGDPPGTEDHQLQRSDAGESLGLRAKAWGGDSSGTEFFFERYICVLHKTIVNQ